MHQEILEKHPRILALHLWLVAVGNQHDGSCDKARQNRVLLGHLPLDLQQYYRHTMEDHLHP